MDRKEIQEQRIRGYFIQATKEMLKGEGLRSINVRAVSERAGYSYTTLYNYFKDLKELVFICVQDFQDECLEYVQSSVENSPRGPEKIKNIVKAYIDYFVQYPGTFELFFLEKLDSLSGKLPTAGLIYTFLSRLCDEEWAYCIEQNYCNSEEAEHKMNILNNLSVGLLLFYLNRMYPASYETFQANTDSQLTRILG